ncbi:SH2 domain protein A [Artemisia annua]|uniref:SH2 domain protein A n=1 Tax=Artemisia annua TaxID=35608 RepID=A0A2U1LEY2_ARTAN|nr:SH2 domain protein A [Artemisia annua]
MPLSGFFVSRLLNLPSHYAAGLILVGCCPGGTASNIVTYIARGNVALSVLMTAASTLSAVVMTPLLTAKLAGQYVAVDAIGLLMSTLQVVLLPVVVGAFMNQYLKGVVKFVSPFMPPFAVATVAILCGNAIAQSSSAILMSGQQVVLAAVLLHISGFFFGYVLSRTLGIDVSSSRTISIEVGMQNSVLGVVLATQHFGNPLTAVPCAVSSVCHSILGNIINEKDDFNGIFSLCFWLYYPHPFPSTILHQHTSDITSATPFLELNVNKELVLYPIRAVPQGATVTNDVARTKNEVPFNKWVHIGCEVTTDFMRLYMNGVIVGETRVTCTADSLRKIYLIGANEYDSIYLHGVEILPIMSSIKYFYVKDPPVQLHFDATSATDVEVDGDGVWTVLGGKAPSRRNFSLTVVLKDAFARSVNKEMELVATLTYADNGAHVEKLDNAEAPLLTCKDGVEFASWDKPTRLISGHASFRLWISKLSSQCDNRLFRIKFNVFKMGRRYPFLEAFSRPIRCILPNLVPNPRTSTLIWKRSTSAIHTFNGPSWLNGGTMEPINNVVHESKLTPLSKRIKLGQANPVVNVKPDNVLKQPDVVRHEDGRLNGRTLDGKQEPHERACNLVTSASEKDVMNFAEQVAQFSGCHHHRNIIRISKRMIEDGTKVWNSLSQNFDHVWWDKMILVLRDQFIKISCCRNRFLVHQDFEVLRRIGGFQEKVIQENFEKMWCWLYPVAFALSQNGLNEMWDTRWIEGFVTKEEAESSLHGLGGTLVDPGTFTLRFPTSRSWPHPDAGNLIITYVGSDFAIHHRLLSLDFFHSSGGKSLKDMLLEESELSRLGRITSRSVRLV